MKSIALLCNPITCVLLWALAPMAAPAATLLYGTVNDPSSGLAPGIVRVDENGSYSAWSVTSIVLQNPQGIAVDGGGNVFVNDGANIYKITPDGNGSLFATKPESANSLGLALDAAGNVYATGRSEGSNVIFRYNAAGTLTATWNGSATGLEIAPNGLLYTADTEFSMIWEYDSSGARRGYFGVTGVRDIDIDTAGNLYVTALNRRVYKVTSDSTILTWYSFGLSITATAVAVDEDANAYVGIRTSGGDSHIRKLNTDPMEVGAPFTDLTNEQRINFLSAVPVPEAEAGWLMLAGAVALGSRRRRRG